jgi:hypothetical protein
VCTTMALYFHLVKIILFAEVVEKWESPCCKQELSIRLKDELRFRQHNITTRT